MSMGGSLKVALRATLAGAFAIAIFDLVLTCVRATQPVPAFAFVRALQASIGLYAVAGLVIGVLAGRGAGGLPAPLPVAATVRDWVRVVRRDPERDRAHAAGVLAAAACLGALAVLVFGYLLAVGLEMSN